MKEEQNRKNSFKVEKKRDNETGRINEESCWLKK